MQIWSHVQPHVRREDAEAIATELSLAMPGGAALYGASTETRSPRSLRTRLCSIAGVGSAEQLPLVPCDIARVTPMRLTYSVARLRFLVVCCADSHGAVAAW